MRSELAIICILVEMFDSVSDRRAGSGTNKPPVPAVVPKKLPAASRLRPDTKNAASAGSPQRPGFRSRVMAGAKMNRSVVCYAFC